MQVKHGIKNKDMNVAVVPKKPKGITEDVAVSSPSLKTPKATCYILHC
jgi:hypothetical protein